LLVVGDQASEPSSERDRPGVGGLAAHRAVRIDRAGDGDEPSGGGVEDDGLPAGFEVIADDPLAISGAGCGVGSRSERSGGEAGWGGSGGELDQLADGPCPAALGAGHQLDRVDALLAGCAVHGHRDLLGPRAAPPAVPTQLLRFTITGRSACSARQFAGLGEEREQMLALVGEVPEQPTVRVMRRARRKQPVGALAKLGDVQAEFLGVDDIALIVKRPSVPATGGPAVRSKSVHAAGTIRWLPYGSGRAAEARRGKQSTTGLRELTGEGEVCGDERAAADRALDPQLAVEDGKPIR
jgi:hypothetical protein